MPTVNVCPGSAQDLQDIADTLGKSRKVIVVTGAGISTNCGIPDFRSENGLYSLIQAQYDAALQNPPWEKKANFDIDDRPKKKRRVTDRWYYEVVPGTGRAVQDTSIQPPEDQETHSPRSQSTSPSNTSRSTPAASRTADSSPLSSPRSITPPPSENLKIASSSTISPQTQTSFAAPSSSSSCSLRSRMSTRLSSIFTKDDISKGNQSQSDSSVPSCSDKIDDNVLTTEPEQESQFQSSQASTTLEDSLKEAPQLSQSSSTRTLPNLKGRDLFDSMVWSDPFTTSIFYMFISSLRDRIRNDVRSTTSTHRFLRTLRDGGRLVRNYTQNIDCLEEREGLCTELSLGPGNRARFHSRTQREPRPGVVGRDSAHNGGVEVVLLHGSLSVLRCGICARLCSWDVENRETETLAGSAPDCPSCTEYSAKRTHRGRRGLAVGRLRPDIVLYGEEHPNANLIAPLITHDLSLGPDFLLIMGTSLKVHGLKVMVKEFAKAVHVRGGKVVFVNRTKPPESTWGEFIDYWVEWDCDEWVLDLQERRGDIWLPQGSQAETINRRESSGDTKAQTRKPSQIWRPQAVRDDKMNGVYNTFKILDTLGQFRDSSGATATRPIYWNSKPLRTVVTKTKSDLSEQSRKSLPAPKISSKEGNNKKRKSCPRALEHGRGKEAIVTDTWERLRKLAPGLGSTPPESSRVALTELHHNRGFPINYIFHRSFPVTHFPNIGGYSLGKINLMTHPPFGADLPIHTPKSLPPPKHTSERKPNTHSYGTRASARLSGISAETTLSIERSSVVEQNPHLPSWDSTENTILVTSTSSESSPLRPRIPSWNSTEDTIVVTTTSTEPLTPRVEDTIVVATTPDLPTPPSRSSTADAIVVATPQADDEEPPTPPISSDPMTPSKERIKRLGSIESILSSSPGWCSSSSTQYYDAVE